MKKFMRAVNYCS